MKLKNKKTGRLVHNANMEVNLYLGMGEHEIYDSLAELYDEWEDYEEPEEFWHITCEGKVTRVPYSEYCHYPEREIGNYFETKEEAELAVEKLKAWKRLKDKGFRFAHCDWTKELTVSDIHIYADIDCEWSDLIEEDLQTVFGGKE